MTRDPLDDLAETVHDLVTPRTHREPLDTIAVNARRGHAQHVLAAAVRDAEAAMGTPGQQEAEAAVQAARMALKVARRTRHHSQQPSLLDQLEAACTPGSADGTMVPPGHGSTPVNEAALDALLRIDAAAARWLSAYCGQRLRSTTADNLRALVGAATLLPHDDQKALARDAHSWLVTARVETGWIRATMTIDRRAFDQRGGTGSDSCPCCEQPRTLRVSGDGEHAWCTNCGACWAEDDPHLPSVSLLAATLHGVAGGA